MSYKVGDKVWYDGEVRIINKIWSIENENYCSLNGIDDDVFILGDLEPYNSAHEQLIEDGWKTQDNKRYDKYDEVIRINMSIKFSNDKYGKYISFSNFAYVDLKLSRILTQYLEEME